MTQEGLFEYGHGRNWDKIMKLALSNLRTASMATTLNKTEIRLLRELQFICGAGLMSLRKSQKGYTYTATELELKFLEQKRPD